MNNWIKTQIQRTPSGKFRWQLVSFSGDTIQHGIANHRIEARTQSSQAYHEAKLTEPNSRDMNALKGRHGT